MISFQKPYKTPNSLAYIQDVIHSGHIEGDGKYTELCTNWLSETLSVDNVFMMTSCTHALDCALQVIGLESGDEVIVPSFTYPSTANAILLAGGEVVFAEVEAENLTISPESIRAKLTDRTKAIIVVHYGGVSCDMEQIMAIAKEYQLVVIEDAAQSFLSTYKGSYTGTIGDLGCFSFHGTKDFVAGEGGVLIVNNDKYLYMVENFRQKGTNRTAYLRGESAFYEWVSKGSSYSPNELSMALLYAQFLLKDDILSQRRSIYRRYKEEINELIRRYHFEDEITISSGEANVVNGHLFFMVFKQVEMAKKFSEYLYEQGIETRTHFVPLHESIMGKQFIRPSNDFRIEKNLGKRLIRLPIYPDLSHEEVNQIIVNIGDFLKHKEVL